MTNPGGISEVGRSSLKISLMCSPKESSLSETIHQINSGAAMQSLK